MTIIKTLEINVAQPAPFNPKAGAPKYPHISTQLRKTLITLQKNRDIHRLLGLGKPFCHLLESLKHHHRNKRSCDNKQVRNCQYTTSSG